MLSEAVFSASGHIKNQINMAPGLERIIII